LAASAIMAVLRGCRFTNASDSDVMRASISVERESTAAVVVTTGLSVQRRKHELGD
jgi:hypothetical protein